MSKLLILAAGIGSRMQESSVKINKGLLPISGKAIITHIIENVIAEEIIIAVGYKSEQIKNYCEVFHSDKKIKFVNVDNYENPGSGPGYSMYCCKDFLQSPFYVVTADSLIKEELPLIDCDWIGVSEVKDPENYSTCDCDSLNNLTNFQNKNNEHSLKYAFTGVMAIKNVNLFWKRFEEYKCSNNEKEIEFVGALYKPFYSNLICKKINWIDVGRKQLYDDAYISSKNFASYELKKIEVNEYVYKIENKFAKISSPEKILNKKKRAFNLQHLIPDMLHEDLENIFCYNFVDGKTLYETNDFDIYINFLNWCDKKLFNRLAVCKEDFHEKCIEFYKDKTNQRVNSFFEKNKEDELDLKIFNRNCLKPKEIFDKINWKLLCENSKCCNFHGDLNFGNAICKKDNDFCLIDWRDDFQGLMFGDLYYDLAKLYAGCEINFYIANQTSNRFSKIGDNVILKSFRTSVDEKFKIYYENWLLERKYNLNKIKLLSSLIYLSMSPLHPKEFGHYLYYYGLFSLNLFFQNYCK